MRLATGVEYPFASSCFVAKRLRRRGGLQVLFPELKLDVRDDHASVSLADSSCGGEVERLREDPVSRNVAGHAWRRVDRPHGRRARHDGQLLDCFELSLDLVIIRIVAFCAKRFGGVEPYSMT